MLKTKRKNIIIVCFHSNTPAIQYSRVLFSSTAEEL